MKRGKQIVYILAIIAFIALSAVGGWAMMGWLWDWKTAGVGLLLGPFAVGFVAHLVKARLENSDSLCVRCYGKIGDARVCPFCGAKQPPAPAWRHSGWEKKPIVLGRRKKGLNRRDGE